MIDLSRKFRGLRILRYWLVAAVLVSSCTGKESDQTGLTAAQAARQAGLEHLDRGNLQEAQAEFSKLIELEPEEVIGYVNLGIVNMRQGEFSAAEELFNKALTLEQDNVTVRLNLFELYQQMDQPEMASTQLEEILTHDPDNLFALYKMSEGMQSNSNSSLTELNEYLERIIGVAPTNFVPRIYLLEHYLENQQYQKARSQFEDIQSKFERLPPEAQDLFNQAYQSLINNQGEKAYADLVMFHNQVKLTDWYQADVRALRGSQYSQIGIPVISFSRKMVGFGSDDENLVYENIKFTDVAENAGLLELEQSPSIQGQNGSSLVALNDMDNDGDQDLLFGINGAGVEKGLYLFRNELGRFEEVSGGSGIDEKKGVEAAVFADYDNDGFLDLFLVVEGYIKLYHNTDEMLYEDVTSNSGLSEIAGVISLLAFDADHDGDLDLFCGINGPDLLFQNNGNGTYSDISNKAGISNSGGRTDQAVFGDFDDDGDLDFFVAREGGNRLYSNTRSGTFEDLTAISGFSNQDASEKVSAGDYNNDGWLDLFISHSSGEFKLYRNQGKGSFIEDTAIQTIEGVDGLKPYHHTFLDYDNDGHLDLLLAGTPLENGDKGLVLLHNDRQQSFENVTWTLPESLNAVSWLAIGDYNEDSDLDIFTSYRDGSIGLLRNDGGNMNYQLKIQLVGLRQGSGKNNYFGIGSKVEIRAGSGYQMRTIAAPSEYFGLGAYERADILRIRWTNGVPQNIFAPNSDLDLIEQQKLKGSCPFLYAWNGVEFAMVKDFMWRSALGMPLGIMTTDHSTAYAFSDASQEYLKIPGDALKLDDDKYKIKVTGELWETIYLDELVLYAVDHPMGIDFQLDEKFVMPPFPNLELYSMKQKHPPASITDGTTDWRDKAMAKDNDYVSNFGPGIFQGITELHDLIIDLGAGIPTENLHLFLNGWIFPSDASINVAVGQSSEISAVPPYLQVLNEQGHWITVVDNLGFPLGKDKTVVTDLSNVFRTNDRRVRIRTSMQIYWDHIYYAHIDEQFKGRITPMSMNQADLNYRGFSQEFRKGVDGPHWFDYNQTTTEPKWMDLEGYYTRYGDVSTLLGSSDNQYVIYNAGDEISISFNSQDLPELPNGWTRDFVIYSVGWVKDGDLNTAYGNTVEPLPFHGMPSYPYPANYQYPAEENEEYLREYHTRYVSPDAYRDHLKQLNP